jgi:hypothetical protein
MSLVETLTEYIKKQTNAIRGFIMEPKGVFEFVDELIKNYRQFIRSVLVGAKVPTVYTLTTKHKFLRE